MMCVQRGSWQSSRCGKPSSSYQIGNFLIIRSSALRCFGWSKPGSFATSFVSSCFLFFQNASRILITFMQRCFPRVKDERRHLTGVLAEAPDGVGEGVRVVVGASVRAVNRDAGGLDLELHGTELRRELRRIVREVDFSP